MKSHYSVWEITKDLKANLSWGSQILGHRDRCMRESKMESRVITPSQPDDFQRWALDVRKDKLPTGIRAST